MKTAPTAILVLLILLPPCWAWHRYVQWGKAPETVILIGHLKDWQESQERLRRTKAPGWNFYFRTSEHPVQFWIPSFIYSERFRCEACPNLSDFRGAAYSRAHQFKRLEESGTRLEFRAGKRALAAATGKEKVPVYALKTENQTYLTWEDTQRGWKEGQPWELVFALALTAFAGAVLWLLWYRRTLTLPNS